MINTLRDWFIGMVCSAKGIVLTISGTMGVFSVFKGNEKDMLEMAIIMTSLFGIGLLNIWVMIGWVAKNDGVAMRKRRMLTWISEMIAGVIVYGFYKHEISQKDFNVGHGQEYVLIYIVVAVVIIIAAQFNLIPYSMEKEAKRPST